MCFENPSKIIHNHKEFSYGSAVSINGRDLGKQKWADKNETPPLLGIIQNPDHYDAREAEEIDEKLESYVTFVMSGYYEWNDTDMLNTVSGKFNNDLLNIIPYSPRDTKPIRYRGPSSPFCERSRKMGPAKPPKPLFRMWIAMV